MQLQDVFKILLIVTNSDTGDIGAIIAHEIGTGKTRIYQAVIAVIRLVRIIKDHLETHPEMHAGCTERCVIGAGPHGWRIRCLRERGSLGAKLAEKFPPGANLVVASKSMVPQAYRDAQGYFKEHLRFTVHGPTTRRFEVPFMRIVSWDSRQEDQMKVARAEAVVDDNNEELQVPRGRGDSRIHPGRTYASNTVFGKRMLACSKVKYRLAAKNPVEAPSIMFIVSRSTLSRTDGNWASAWYADITIELEEQATRGQQTARGPEVAIVRLRSAPHFGLVVWDEAQEVKDVNSSLAKCLRGIINEQVIPPAMILVSGSLVHSNLADMTLAITLTRGLRTSLEIKTLSDTLKTINKYWVDHPSSPIKASHHHELRGFLRRLASSEFMGYVIVSKPDCRRLDVECDLPPEYRDRIAALTREVAKEVLAQLDKRKRAYDSSIRDGRPPVARTGLVVKEFWSLRLLRRALLFPGVLDAQERANQEGKEVELLAQNIDGHLRRAKGPMPRQYAHIHIPNLTPYLDIILVRWGKWIEYESILMQLYEDAREYPTDSDIGAGAKGPKNAMVLLSDPGAVHKAQLYNEKNLPADKFESTMIFAGMSQDDREEAMVWFNTFWEKDGTEKKKSKVLVGSYNLLGTGFDNLKCAVMVIHLEVHPNKNEFDQSVGRIHRRGQPLETVSYQLKTPGQPLEELNLALREERGGLVANLTYVAEGLRAAIEA
ncbi:hypothetical protein COL154_013834 [Colletotrichum chrysophilum]|nr:hypothetical protein COL154_013834 [Colletotrichum chrysophilum]